MDDEPSWAVEWWAPPSWAVAGNRILGVRGQYMGVKALVNEINLTPTYPLYRDAIIEALRSGHSFSWVGVHLCKLGKLDDVRGAINLWIQDGQPLRWDPADWEFVSDGSALCRLLEDDLI